MKCPYCENEMYGELNYCHNCGGKIHRCTKCGTPILFKTSTCIKCGEPIEQSNLRDLPEPDEEQMLQEEMRKKQAEEEKVERKKQEKEEDDWRKKLEEKRRKEKIKKVAMVMGVVAVVAIGAVSVATISRNGADADTETINIDEVGKGIEDARKQLENIGETEVQTIQVPTTQTPTTQAPTTQAPTTQAETRPEDKYKIVNGEYDWEEAQRECERMGGHLVWINNYKEWKYLTKTFIPNQKDAGVKFLVGGRRSEDSHNYYWTDGYEAFGNVLNSEDSWINKHDLWFYSSIQTQPSFYDSNTDENEYYLQLFYIKDTSSNREKGRKIGWSFNDVSISEKMSFICEFE